MTAITPSLFIFTLVGVLAVAVVAYVFFLRKRSNRKPAEEPHLAGRTMAPTEEEHRRNEQA